MTAVGALDAAWLEDDEIDISEVIVELERALERLMAASARIAQRMGHDRRWPPPREDDA